MNTEQTIFAAGCFWGVEDYFHKLKGVTATEVGYTGGHTENPNYEQVCNKDTGHAEAVLVTFDSDIITFEELVTNFWKIHDPTTVNRQGPDIGEQYRSAIFYKSDKQKQIAERVMAELTKANKFSKPIVTEITASETWYRGEEYHQMYFEKRGGGACHV